MIYRLIFDVTTVKSTTHWYVLGALLALLVLAIAIFLYREAGADKDWKPAFFVVWAVFVALMVVTMTVVHISQTHTARKAMQTGNYSVAEGMVQDFVQGGDHKTESFTVNGKRFHYGCCGADYEDFTSDYNPNAEYIHNGVRARITYREDVILKVEVE